MSKKVFKKDGLEPSPYPANVVPIKSTQIIGFDRAGGKDVTVKGFYLNGEYHIQEVIERDL